jgi:hypothetical protein
MQMYIGLKLAPITDVFGPKLVAVKHGNFTEFSFPITTADGLLGRGLSTYTASLQSFSQRHMCRAPHLAHLEAKARRPWLGVMHSISCSATFHQACAMAWPILQTFLRHS